MRKKKDRSGEHLALEPEDFYKILSSLKRCFSRSNVCKEALKKVRSTEPRYKNNGKLHKTPLVRYTCNHCSNKFPSTEVQCDHIESVVPLQIPAIYMSIGILARRIFVSVDKIQILCKSCHHIKTQQENEERRKWLDKPKYIVYMTTNKINNKFYIGVHKCIDLADGYIGSGTYLKKAIDKYGKENFTREVLNVYETSKEAYEAEKEIVSDILVDEDNNYNIALGGIGVSSGESNPMYGKTHSPEIKKKIANRYYPRGKDNSNSRPILCIETNEVFDSCTDARKRYGGNISRALRTGGSSSGYHWKYLDQNSNIELKPIKYSKRRVMCVETGEIFESLVEAAKKYLGRGDKIGECCRGKRHKHSGYSWKFLET